MLGKFDEGSLFIVFIVSDKVITISYLAVTTSLALIIMIDVNEFVKYYIEEELKFLMKFLIMLIYYTLEKV